MYYLKMNYEMGYDVFETLDEAMDYADSHAAYTGHDINICDNKGRIIADRVWYGCSADPEITDMEKIIDFGEDGFYDEWDDISEHVNRQVPMWSCGDD